MKNSFYCLRAHASRRIRGRTQPGAVVHICNPSYLGGRDQEDHGLKPAQANSSKTLSQKKKITKKGWGGSQGEGPEFKSQYCKN
jgi:hypothetical protein